MHVHVNIGCRRYHIGSKTGHLPVRSVGVTPSPAHPSFGAGLTSWSSLSRSFSLHVVIIVMCSVNSLLLPPRRSSGLGFFYLRGRADRVFRFLERE